MCRWCWIMVPGKQGWYNLWMHCNGTTFIFSIPLCFQQVKQMMCSMLCVFLVSPSHHTLEICHKFPGLPKHTQHYFHTPELMNVRSVCWSETASSFLCVFFLCVLVCPGALLIVSDDWKIILLTCWQKNVEVISQDQRYRWSEPSIAWD